MSSEVDVARLYVLVPPSPLFAAHWSFFIPDPPPLDPNKRQCRLEESTIGRRIHVVGDRLNGFKMEIVRGYDLKKDRSNSSGRKFAIGVVEAASISGSFLPSGGFNAIEDTAQQKDEDEGGGIVDTQARDKFERICVGAEAPGPSLRKISTNGSKQNEGIQSRLEVRDCQWWIHGVVDTLVKQSILVSAQSKLETDRNQSPKVIVEKLPKTLKTGGLRQRLKC